jgi:hypothetical protein
MSKMSTLYLDISERLLHDIDPQKIAKSLGVPIDWVFAVEANMQLDSDKHTGSREYRFDNKSIA